MARKEGTLIVASNIEAKLNAPLDARSVVATKEDLTSEGSFQHFYDGMVVSVASEGKLYVLKGTDPTAPESWNEVGCGSNIAGNGGAAGSSGFVSQLKPCKAFTGKLPTFNISNQGWSSWSTSDYNTTEANIEANNFNVRASVVPFVAGQNPGGKLASLLAPPTNTTYNRTVSLSLEKALNGFAYTIRPNLNYNGSIYYTTETGGWRVYQGTPDSAVYSTGSMAYFSLLIQTTVPIARGQRLFDFEKAEAFQYSCPLQVGDPISTLNDYSYAPNAYILHNDTTSANVLGSTFGNLLRKIVPMTMSAHYAFTHTANADTCLIMIAARLTLCTDIPVTTTAEGYRSIAIGDLPAIVVPTNLFGNMLID